VGEIPAGILATFGVESARKALETKELERQFAGSADVLAPEVGTATEISSAISGEAFPLAVTLLSGAGAARAGGLLNLSTKARRGLAQWTASSFGGARSATGNVKELAASGASDEALFRAGLKGFATTTLLTQGFNLAGAGGVEAFRASKDAFIAATKKSLRAKLGQASATIGKGAIGEGAEEWIDQYASALYTNAEKSFEDKKTPEEIHDEAMFAASIGAIIGGGHSTLQAAGDFAATPTAEREVADTPVDTPAAPDIVGEADPVAAGERRLQDIAGVETPAPTEDQGTAAQTTEELEQRANEIYTEPDAAPEVEPLVEPTVDEAPEPLVESEPEVTPEPEAVEDTAPEPDVVTKDAPEAAPDVITKDAPEAAPEEKPLTKSQERRRDAANAKRIDTITNRVAGKSPNATRDTVNDALTDQIIKDPDTPDALLTTIAKRAASRRGDVRKAEREAKEAGKVGTIDTGLPVEDAAATPFEVAEVSDQKAQLQDAVKTLNATEQKVVNGHLAEKSNEEIAEELGTSAKTVASTLSRALPKLRKTLEVDPRSEGKTDEQVVEQVRASLLSDPDPRAQAAAKKIKVSKKDNAQIRAAKKIAKAFGRNVVIVNGLEQNGLFSPEVSDAIVISAKASRAETLVAFHEMLHSLRATNKTAYDKLNKAVDADLEAYIKEFPERSEGTADRVKEEFLADFLADRATNPDFWKNLAETDQSLFATLRDALQKLLKKITQGRLGTERFVKDLEAADAAAAEALTALRAEGVDVDAEGDARFEEQIKEAQTLMRVPQSAGNNNPMKDERAVTNYKEAEKIIAKTTGFNWETQPVTKDGQQDAELFLTSLLDPKVIESMQKDLREAGYSDDRTIIATGLARASFFAYATRVYQTDPRGAADLMAKGFILANDVKVLFFPREGKDYAEADASTIGATLRSFRTLGGGNVMTLLTTELEARSEFVKDRFSKEDLEFIQRVNEVRLDLEKGEDKASAEKIAEDAVLGTVDAQAVKELKAHERRAIKAFQRVADALRAVSKVRFESKLSTAVDALQNAIDSGDFDAMSDALDSAMQSFEQHTTPKIQKAAATARNSNARAATARKTAEEKASKIFDTPQKKDKKADKPRTLQQILQQDVIENPHRLILNQKDRIKLAEEILAEKTDLSPAQIKKVAAEVEKNLDTLLEAKKKKVAAPILKSLGEGGGLTPAQINSAIRLQVLDPSKDLTTSVAALSGWVGLTGVETAKLADLERKIEAVGQNTRSAMGFRYRQMRIIRTSTGLAPTARKLLNSYIRGSMYSSTNSQFLGPMVGAWVISSVMVRETAKLAFDSTLPISQRLGAIISLHKRGVANIARGVREFRAVWKTGTAFNAATALAGGQEIETQGRVVVDDLTTFYDVETKRLTKAVSDHTSGPTKKSAARVRSVFTRFAIAAQRFTFIGLTSADAAATKTAASIQAEVLADRRARQAGLTKAEMDNIRNVYTNDAKGMDDQLKSAGIDNANLRAIEIQDRIEGAIFQAYTDQINEFNETATPEGQVEGVNTLLDEAVRDVQSQIGTGETNNTPLGNLTALISSNVNKLPFGPLVVPAVRTVGNVTDELMWTVPVVGLIRAYGVKFSKNKKANREAFRNLSSDWQFNKRVNLAITSHVLTAVAVALLEANEDLPDEDKWFYYTGFFPAGDKAEQNRWKANGWVEHTLIVGNTRIRLDRGFGQSLLFPVTIASTIQKSSKALRDVEDGKLTPDQAYDKMFADLTGYTDLVIPGWSSVRQLDDSLDRREGLGRYLGSRASVLVPFSGLAKTPRRVAERPNPRQTEASILNYNPYYVNTDGEGVVVYRNALFEPLENTSSAWEYVRKLGIPIYLEPTARNRDPVKKEIMDLRIENGITAGSPMTRQEFNQLALDSGKTSLNGDFNAFGEAVADEIVARYQKVSKSWPDNPTKKQLSAALSKLTTDAEKKVAKEQGYKPTSSTKKRERQEKKARKPLRT
jgi:RNA polymerase sigma factor (sigma-70 family)